MKHLYNFFSKRKKICLKNIALGLTFMLAGFNTIDAQVSSYSFAQSASTYTPITGNVLEAATGNTSATNLNSNVYLVALPFNFVFNGTSYNEIYVSTNGFITFGVTIPVTILAAPISSTLAYDGAVSAFGRDISSVFDVNGVTGDISWQTLGTAPNREAVIQWRNFRPNSSTSTTAAYTFSFQIRLQETSNVIRMVYDNGSYLAGSTAITGTAQIGLRGSTNTDFNTRFNINTVGFTNSTVSTVNNNAQAFDTVNAIPGMPTAGLTYTWTPLTCSAPVGLIAGTSTSGSANISWSSSASPPANGYDIYYTTSNIPPTASTPPTVTAVTGTSTTLNSLAPSSLHYVWIRANCGGGNTSTWSLQHVVTQCQPPAIASTAGATGCNGSSVTLSAVVDPSVTPIWYDANTGGNTVATGSSYTTPPLASTTNYWVSAASIGSDAYIGENTPTSATGFSSFGDFGLMFDAYSPMIIKEVDIYPMGTGTTGTVVINLKDSDGNILQSKTVSVNMSAAGTLNTINLNFKVPLAGMNYRLVVEVVTDIDNLRRESTTGFTYPYTLAGVCNIKSAVYNGTSNSSLYFYLYNWKVTPICESARTMVTATLDSNCLSTSEVNGEEKMNVYPNPFEDIITITDIEKVKSVNVLDASGRIVKTIDNLFSKEIYLGDLKSGLYILNLIMKNGSVASVKALKK